MIADKLVGAQTEVKENDQTGEFPRLFSLSKILFDRPRDFRTFNKFKKSVDQTRRNP